MQTILTQEPRAVWRYFTEICAIPHGSGNTARLADYCAAFARQHRLAHRLDAAGNVVIFKDAAPGYENAPPLLLQGHLDMVGARESDTTFDFETDALRLQVQGDYLSAEGTSLGGDDGIAVACILAILAAEDLPHPALEVVLTVDEETGMDGAAALDVSDLRSRRMLNLDSEEEGVFLAGCAGGVRVETHLPVVRTGITGVTCTLTLSGLTGGHSGIEIHKNRANANREMGVLLHAASETVPMHLLSLNGGEKDNAIARECTAQLLLDEQDIPALTAIVQQAETALREAYAATDPQLQLTLEQNGVRTAAALSATDTRRIAALLAALPNGVQAMNPALPMQVETSLNFGRMYLSETELTLHHALRSSDTAAKQALSQRLETLAASFGGSYTRSGDYPAWEYRADSPLREQLCRVYQELTGKIPTVAVIHAGLECGLFAEKLPELDCVSLGPDMEGVHTPQERLSISSVQRTWALLCAFLRQYH